MTTKNISEIIKSSDRITQIIKCIDSFDKEHLYLTGGSLRNVVWNYIHQYSEYYELEDCDIIFHNKANISKDYELFIKKELSITCPNIQWSVKNQARMHLKNGHRQYKDIYAALLAFPETCSAIGVDKNWHIISPCGVNDIGQLIIRPTKFCQEKEMDVFYDRIEKKNWLKKWKKLNIQINTDSLSRAIRA